MHLHKVVVWLVLMCMFARLRSPSHNTLGPGPAKKTFIFHESKALDFTQKDCK